MQAKREEWVRGVSGGAELEDARRIRRREFVSRERPGGVRRRGRDCYCTREDEVTGLQRGGRLGEDCRGEEYLRKVWRHGCWERGRDQLRTRGEDFTRDQLRRGDDRERRGARSIIISEN